MDRLKLFAAIMKFVWWLAGLITAAKKNKAEPVETVMDPADTAPAVKLPIGRTASRSGQKAKRKFDPVTNKWN